MRRGTRKYLISMIVIMIMSVSQTIAFAGDTWEDKAKEITSAKEFSTDNMSRTVIQPRGSLISSFEISITDKGNGTAGLYGAVLCHEPMKSIRMNLYLDIWNAELEDWEQIQSYKFIWDETNTPEDERNAGVVGFDVNGLERGRDYRLRGFASAFNLDGSLNEAWRADSQYIQVQSIEDPLVTE